tara:strand:- start:1610 stop:1774 length:165 start_codon:yes stop_codon:yes gene_type:complete
MLNKEEEKKESIKWIDVAEANLLKELQNQMHNEWVKTFGCGNPNCLICNSAKKP